MGVPSPRASPIFSCHSPTSVAAARVLLSASRGGAPSPLLQRTSSPIAKPARPRAADAVAAEAATAEAAAAEAAVAEARAAAAEAGLLFGMIPYKAAANAVNEACVDADSSGDDCSAFVSGCATSCPDACDYTAPEWEVTANTPIDWTSTAAVDDVEKFMTLLQASSSVQIPRE